MDEKPEHFLGQVTQKALIQRDGKILLTKCPPQDRAAGRLDFPGGRLHQGEQVLDALRREVMEEIGVEIEVGKIVATGTMINMADFPTYFVMYEADLKDPTQKFVVQPEEVETAEWYDVKDFSSLPIIYPQYQEALKNYFK